MSWYAIRTVYDWGTKTDGTAVFEERIVVFEATSWDEAHTKARAPAAWPCGRHGCGLPRCGDCCLKEGLFKE